eukprot:620509-Alexandrium_andersonii.AAC.1
MARVTLQASELYGMRSLEFPYDPPGAFPLCNAASAEAPSVPPAAASGSSDHGAPRSAAVAGAAQGPRASAAAA